jgi:hypothetical protein
VVRNDTDTDFGIVLDTAFDIVPRIVFGIVPPAFARRIAGKLAEWLELDLDMTAGIGHRMAAIPAHLVRERAE